MTGDCWRSRVAAALAVLCGLAATPPAFAADSAAGGPAAPAAGATVAEGKAAPAAEKKAPAPAAPAAKPSEPAPATTSSSGAGIGGAIDDFIRRTGDRWTQDLRFEFLGVNLKPRLRISEQISYTDNVFYQAKDEKLVLNRNPPIGDQTQVARPRLGEPRARTGDIVNLAALNFGLEMPVNTALVPIVKDRARSVRLLDTNVTSVVYMKHHDSPDALNWDATVDAPAVLNDLIQRVMRLNVGSGIVYFRTEGGYSKITDPLDVAKFHVHDEPPTFVNAEERNDFERIEYHAKGTLGWRGKVWDAMVGAKYYNFRVKDRSLNSADHRQSSYFSEVGHTFQGTEQRAFVLFEYTDFGFDERTQILTRDAEGGEVTTLRDFDRWKAGIGWEGPVLTKKLSGRVEVYWIGIDVDDRRKLPRPVLVDPDDPGNWYFRNFDEPHLVGGSARFKYSPFAKTQLALEYARAVEWSVVSENKVVDRATFTASHEFTPRVMGTFKYSIENENVAWLQKRTFQEVGIGVRYKLFKYTYLTAEYTLRHMRSRREPTAVYADRFNEVYTVRANGDFTANIITVGVVIEF